MLKVQRSAPETRSQQSCNGDRRSKDTEVGLSCLLRGSFNHLKRNAVLYFLHEQTVDFVTIYQGFRQKKDCQLFKINDRGWLKTHFEIGLKSPTLKKPWKAVETSVFIEYFRGLLSGHYVTLFPLTSIVISMMYSTIFFSCSIICISFLYFWKFWNICKSTCLTFFK